MAQSKLRLAPDPAVGIRDIMNVFLDQYRDDKDFDVYGTVDPPAGVRWNWKTSPCCKWISQMKSLLLGFLKLAPNGVLASTKVRGACSKLCQEKEYKKHRFNKTKLHDFDFCDQVDQKLRIVLSQVRELKKSSDEYARAMKKATPGEKANIDEILSHLRVQAGWELQIAVYEAPTRDAAAAASHASSSKGPSEEEPKSIFQRILQKRVSSPSKISETPEIVKRGLKRQNAFMQPALQRQRAFCVAPEESTGSEPATPMKPKRVKSEKLPGSSSRFSVLGLDEEDQDLMADSFEKGVSAKDMAKKSKPKSKAEAAASTSAKAKAKSSPRQGVYKSSWRRRVKDASYHKAKVQALREGLSPKAACLKAREASRKTAAEIDAGVLKEEG